MKTKQYSPAPNTTLRIDSLTMSNTAGQGYTVNPTNPKEGFTKAEMISALDRFHEIYGAHEGIVTASSSLFGPLRRRFRNRFAAQRWREFKQAKLGFIRSRYATWPRRWGPNL